ncbi:hypothetical protein [Marinobacter sp.]|uniref:hypothetical protein n=1 Tax=Marinobacter sp. TaxID=50741 RepID=UPI003850DBB6
MLAGLRNNVADAFRVLLVERRLPHGWVSRWHDLRYKAALEKTLREAASVDPIPSSNKPLAELHLVTCSRDLFMAILAVKSLLRFTDQLAVVFHGDRSLDEAGARKLKEQIPGCRVVLLEEADKKAEKHPEILRLREALPERFRLASGYEAQRRAWALKVFDFHLFAQCDRVIVLDSDTLFLQRPDELINFIGGREPCGFYAVPRLRNLKMPDQLIVNYFPQAHVIPRFNGGLFGFDQTQMPVSLLRDITEKVINSPEIVIMGDECLWRFFFAHRNAKPLTFDRYPLTTDLGRSKELASRQKDIVYIHFILKHKGGFYQKMAAKVGLELRQHAVGSEMREKQTLKGCQ